MLAKEIADILCAAPLTEWDEKIMNQDYRNVFATDLMSDALAMIQDNEESTVLLTGLCNSQTLRTAEMLDVRFIVFVRGKYLQDIDLEMAKNMDITCLATDLTMYDACGRLYQKGVAGIYG